MQVQNRIVVRYLGGLTNSQTIEGSDYFSLKKYETFSFH